MEPHRARDEDELEKMVAQLLDLVPTLHFVASKLERVMPDLGADLRCVADDCASVVKRLRERRY